MSVETGERITYSELNERAERAAAGGGWFRMPLQDNTHVVEGQIAANGYNSSSLDAALTEGISSENAKKAGKGRLLLWSVKADNWAETAKVEKWVPIMESWADHGEPARCVLYYLQSDRNTQIYLLSRGCPRAEDLEAAAGLWRTHDLV